MTALQQLVAPLVSIGGLAIAMVTTWLTMRQYYDKRRVEDRQRQLEELERLQAARQKELDEYAEGEKKAYAAERDFQHLMRKYEALALNLDTLMKFHEREARDIESNLKDIKGMLNALITQVCGSETAVLRFLKKSDP